MYSSANRFSKKLKNENALQFSVSKKMKIEIQHQISSFNP